MSKFHQVNAEDWVKGDYRPTAQINVKTSDLAKKFDLTFEDYYESGMGITKVGNFMTETGIQFYLQEYPTINVINTYIGCLNDPETLGKDLDEILEALGLTSEKIIYLYEDVKLIPHELWRQDDNGHKFLVETFICKTDAVKAMKDFEGRGHKQTYWVEEIN